MGDPILEYILNSIINNLDKVLIVGTAYTFSTWIIEVVADYSGTRVHPGMEPMPKPWEETCDCPVCYDPNAPRRSDFEMSFEDWEKMVLEEIERNKSKK